MRQKLKRFISFCEVTAIIIFAFITGAACYRQVTHEPEPYVMPREYVCEEYEIEDISICHGSLESETVIEETETDLSDIETISEEMETEIAPVQQYFYDIPLSKELQAAVKDLTDSYEISYELILAVIMTESSGKPESIGDGGQAIGLMQIQPKWYQTLIENTGLNLDEPVENVELGIIILKGYIEANGGDVTRALKQYNSGNPDYEGNEYVNRVNEWIEYFNFKRKEAGDEVQ